MFRAVDLDEVIKATGKRIYVVTDKREGYFGEDFTYEDLNDEVFEYLEPSEDEYGNFEFYVETVYAPDFYTFWDGMEGYKVECYDIYGAWDILETVETEDEEARIRDIEEVVEQAVEWAKEAE